METPETLRFARSHEWLRDNGDGTVTVGVSAHAQEALGDVVFVELPEVGRQVKAGESFGVVESVKAASDIYAPVGGTVTEVNQVLVDAPETINSSPYGEGWLITLEPSDPKEADALLDLSAYEALVEAEA